MLGFRSQRTLALTRSGAFQRHRRLHVGRIPHGREKIKY
jgi:hypothetical protein